MSDQYTPTTDEVRDSLVYLNKYHAKQYGDVDLMVVGSETAAQFDRMIAEVERAAAEKALLRFEDRLLLELEATERAGIDLGQDYLHGMRSCLSQIGDEAKVYAYRREETE